jgi:hypothetical protein
MPVWGDFFFWTPAFWFVDPLSGVKIMNIREEIIKALDTLSEDSLEGVLEYVRFIQEPEEVDPTEEEKAIIARGKAEIAHGDSINWRDLKKELDKDAL